MLEDYAQALIDGLTVRQAAVRCGVRKTPPFCGVTASLKAMASRQAVRERVSSRPMRPSSWSRLKGNVVCPARPAIVGQRPYPRHRVGLHPGDGGSGPGWHHADFQLEKMNAETVAVLAPLSARMRCCSDGAGCMPVSAKRRMTHQVARNRQGERVVGAYHPACERHHPAVERGWKVVPWVE